VAGEAHLGPCVGAYTFQREYLAFAELVMKHLHANPDVGTAIRLGVALAAQVFEVAARYPAR